MKKIILLASAVALTASVTAASAAVATNGLVVGGNLGYAWVKTPDIDSLNNNVVSQSDNNFAWGGFVGINFAVAPNFMLGAEGGYNDYGSSKYSALGSNVKFSTTAWDLLGKGTFVFDNGINIFGKAGVAWVKEDADLNTPAGSLSDDNKKVRPEVGVGVGYMLNNINFTVEYRHIFADDQNSITAKEDGVPTVNALMAGISYQFNI